MICPHCGVAFHEDWSLVANGPVCFDGTIGTGIEYDICPECNEPIIRVVHGPVENEDFLEDDNEEVILDDKKIVYPYSIEIGLSEDIPDIYKEDFIEAMKLMSQSPKASAALSRRLLQKLLIDEAKIKGASLSIQIEKFCSNDDIPSVLKESVDAIRNIGNFAAHPLKDKNTGEIIEVEPGEAEWSLDIVRGLFDYFFIQPARLQRRRDELNIKLKSMGKPLLK
ncbi:DUF4145 domain-containing protein [Pelolinea submarina]|uniref:Uncharacterized protein DUF4145 n=1 Tax=Pelolinea submarina TaxID=913107 RepID=A0A3E0AB93_9CHLR|nr:DUF4145 domain-containing protein [Pelolinea submarina]REG08746.1 uncharacterized protein DUF4145 [Pelolinea submarina]